MKSLLFVLSLSLLLPLACAAQTAATTRQQPAAPPAAKAAGTAATSPASPATVPAAVSPADAALNRRIENVVRNLTEVPATVSIEVGTRSPSPYPGWDKVPIVFTGSRGKQTLDFLVNKDNTKLARFNSYDLAADPMTEINVNGRPVRGNKDAKVTIVNYDDFQCPFCARMHALLAGEILKTYGKEVRIIYKDFPLVDIHPWAKRAAMVSNCLAVQNPDAYWDFADEVHADPSKISEGGTPTVQLTKIAMDIAGKRALDTKKLDACLKSDNDVAVRASAQEADGLGVSATPTMYINGEKIEGAVSATELHAAINRALRDAGEPLPPGAELPSATVAGDTK